MGRRLLVIAAWCCLAGCKGGPERVSPAVRTYQEGDCRGAMSALAPRLERRGADKALNNLRFASAAIGCGEYEEAREALARACGIMEDFRPDGEWKAVVVAEEKKVYRGDPYEKMCAFLLLGILDYQAGEFDKALASFKSAALADAGTRLERYRADCALPYFMQGKALFRLGEKPQAREAFEQAKKVARFKTAVQFADSALTLAARGLRAELGGRGRRDAEDAVGFLMDSVFEEVSGAAWETLDPVETVTQSCRGARAKIASLSGGRAWKKRFGKIDRAQVEASIGRLQSDALGILRSHVRGPEGSAEPLCRFMDRAAGEDVNCLVFLLTGKGPVKERLGKYGEILRIGRQSYMNTACRVEAGARLLAGPETMEDIYYQASTRGGREMDSVLKGKAVFKDATAAGAASGYDLTRALARSAMNAPRQGGGGSEAALAMAAVTVVAATVSLGLDAASRATNPAADIRCWEMVPDRITLACGRVEPGARDVLFEYSNLRPFSPQWSQRWQGVEIPAKGEAVLLVVNTGTGIVPPSNPRLAGPKAR